MMRLERDGSEPVSGQIARHVTDARIRPMALSIPKTQPMSRVTCNEQQLMAKKAPDTLLHGFYEAIGRRSINFWRSVLKRKMRLP